MHQNPAVEPTGPSATSGPAPVSLPSAGTEALRVPAGLDPVAWRRAAHRLLTKMVAEFAYEELLVPEPDGPDDGTDRSTHTGGRTGGGDDGQPGGRPDGGSDNGVARGADRRTDGGGGFRPYRLRASDDLTLRFRARRTAYGHWHIEPGSLTPADADPFRFLAGAHDTLLGLSGETTGHLVRELTATLTADVRLAARELTAAQLADLDYAELEGHQVGHPWLVANKGRLNFSASDAEHWSPEARREHRIPWAAVHRRLARYRGVSALAEPGHLYAQELDPATLRRFRDTLHARGLDPDGYLFLPVHPWQWDETIVPLFTPYLASGEIVPLETDGDLRLAQQSIRTFLNTSRPDRHTVKLPLAILNTLVWRGLPTDRTLAAPAVTAWVHRLRDDDPYLADECRVVLPGEVASVTVPHPVYDSLPEVPYQYRELLGCIWREPLAARLDAGERARTLAALIHTDGQGRGVTAELVERSGLEPRVWLRHLFAALLPPLLHFLYRYGTVFSPHGENAIVVFDDSDVPVRLAVKDFVDDVNISAEPLPELEAMPEDVRRVLLTEPPAFLTQFIHSGLFVGVFRYLAPLCEDQLGVTEDEFWSLVRAEIERYHLRFPELKSRFETFDLFTSRIERLCLNRNRLHLDGYRDRPERPHAAVHGTVANPLHAV